MPDVFIQYLTSLRDDRAALAELRRGLGRPSQLGLYRHVARFLSPHTTPWHERALLTIAPLFGLHPEPGDVTLPVALARVAQARDSGSIEARFIALLDAETEDLPVHLRHAITLVRGHTPTIAVDYDDLLRTVRAWSHPHRYAQRRWARAYWSPTSTPAPTHPEGEDSP